MSHTGRTKVAGVIGWPVGHSRSPRLHGYWLEKYGIDGAYIPLAVHPRTADAAIRALPALGFRGANVTVPHKPVAYDAVDRREPSAQRVGAVNTLVVGDDGALIGSNTDGYGFLENLREDAPDWSAPAVVLGAGGAARAIVAALQDAGVSEIRLANRTRARADELARDLNGTRLVVVDWDRRAGALDGAGLLVNTTTLGMEGQPDLEIALDGLARDAVVNDIVYVPLETPLLRAARCGGFRPVDGLGMLLHQARPGFTAWFGTDPEVDQGLRDHVLGGS